MLKTTCKLVESSRLEEFDSTDLTSRKKTQTMLEIFENSIASTMRVNLKSTETRKCHHCGIIIGHVCVNCKKLQKERAGVAKLEDCEEFEEDVGAMESQEWRLKKNPDGPY